MEHNVFSMLLLQLIGLKLDFTYWHCH